MFITFEGGEGAGKDNRGDAGSIVLTGSDALDTHARTPEKDEGVKRLALKGPSGELPDQQKTGEETGLDSEESDDRGPCRQLGEAEMQEGRGQRDTQHEASAGSQGRGSGGRMSLAQGQTQKGGIARHRGGQGPAEREEPERIHAAGANSEHGQTEVEPIEAFRRPSFVRCACHLDRCHERA